MPCLSLGVSAAEGSPARARAAPSRCPGWNPRQLDLASRGRAQSGTQGRRGPRRLSGGILRGEVTDGRTNEPLTNASGAARCEEATTRLLPLPPVGEVCGAAGVTAGASDWTDWPDAISALHIELHLRLRPWASVAAAAYCGREGGGRLVPGGRQQ
ncbi:hypothetical protein VTJ04DRAFT_9728 [Mycothermus thermophilus]|uniref:uncharacterized protein n=1 Tax=Humicola insolens TaxID=85995 RepID=UPI003744A9BA